MAPFDKVTDEWAFHERLPHKNFLYWTPTLSDVVLRQDSRIKRTSKSLFTKKRTFLSKKEEKNRRILPV